MTNYTSYLCRSSPCITLFCVCVCSRARHNSVRWFKYYRKLNNVNRVIFVCCVSKQRKCWYISIKEMVSENWFSWNYLGSLVSINIATLACWAFAKPQNMLLLVLPFALMAVVVVVGIHPDGHAEPRKCCFDKEFTATLGQMGGSVNLSTGRLHVLDVSSQSFFLSLLP